MLTLRNPSKRGFKMEIYIEKPISLGKRISAFLIVGLIAACSISGVFFVEKIRAKANDFALPEAEILFITQDNSILPISNPSLPENVQKIKMVITAYSSTPWETDNDPFITASGSEVKDGIVANNLLPFGTKVRIPEIYGDKIFVVEDRMNWKKGYYHLDIWFANHLQAKSFGAKRTYIEVLEN